MTSRSNQQEAPTVRISRARTVPAILLKPGRRIWAYCLADQNLPKRDAQAARRNPDAPVQAWALQTLRNHGWL